LLFVHFGSFAADQRKDPRAGGPEWGGLLDR
jgi:hypothetical protein